MQKRLDRKQKIAARLASELDSLAAIRGDLHDMYNEKREERNRALDEVAKAIAQLTDSITASNDQTDDQSLQPKRRVDIPEEVSKNRDYEILRDWKRCRHN